MSKSEKLKKLYAYEIEYLIMIINCQGCKLNSYMPRHPDVDDYYKKIELTEDWNSLKAPEYPLAWERLQEFELVEVVGSYKWKTKLTTQEVIEAIRS